MKNEELGKVEINFNMLNLAQQKPIRNFVFTLESTLKDHPEKLDELKLFLKNYQESAVFSNDLNRSREVKSEAQEFLILEDNVVSGYFSLLRPASRSIYVQTTSVWIKILLKIIKW